MLMSAGVDYLGWPLMMRGTTLQRSCAVTSLFIGSFIAFAQGEHDIWYFGSHAGLDFSGGTPVALSDCAVDTYEGTSVAADATGQLLFYSDGETIWNREHAVMANGDGLLGSYTSTESCLIVPRPGSPVLYDVFTVAPMGWAQGFCHSVVDMTLDGGLGAVTAEKNIQLLTPVCEKLIGLPHANGFDAWIVVHLLNSDAYYAYLLTATGVDPMPVVSHAGSIAGGSSISALGYLKCNASFSRLAAAQEAEDIVEILDVDRATGIISNVVALPGGHLPYGVEFSPDGSKLYFTAWSDYLFQYDLSAGSVEAIVTSLDSIGPAGSGSGALQVGPDGRIYMARWGNHLGVIAYPDQPLASCGFDPAGLQLSGSSECALGLPLIYPIAHGSVGVAHAGTIGARLFVSPNPARDQVTVALDGFYGAGSLLLRISTMDGRVMLEHRWPTGIPSLHVDLNALPAGTYLLCLVDEDKALSCRPFTIHH